MSHPQSPVTADSEPVRCPVIPLDERRLIELERSLAETRARLGRLQRKRLKIDLKAGKLWRKLARLRREASACSERLAGADAADAADGGGDRPACPSTFAGLFGRR